MQNPRRHSPLHSRHLVPLAIVGLGVGSAGATCNGSHDKPPVVRETCVSCHQADYEATDDPVHRDDPARYHARCMDCHAVESWSPALTGPHPEDEFPTVGTSHDYACVD